jgi:hypothetical protein
VSPNIKQLEKLEPDIKDLQILENITSEKLMNTREYILMSNIKSNKGV